MTRVVQEKSVSPSQERSLILWFDQVGISDIGLVGGKNASLGEMIQQLVSKGVKVPDGFATTAYAFRYFIEKAGLKAQLSNLFADLDVDDVNKLQQTGKQARALIMHTAFPVDLTDAIAQAYRFYSFGDAMLILPEATITRP